jgi:hypothetical protein
MHPELVLYNEMRSAIAACARIDEVAGLKNKAVQLEAYARIRDDKESQRAFAEVRLRACIRIGEISRDLEVSEQSKGGRHPKDRNPTKTEQLAEAGIPISTANDYEQLTGGREELAQEIAQAAAEAYLRSDSELSMGGLKSAVRQALVTAFGEPVHKERAAPKREPDLLGQFLYSADLVYRKRENFDPALLAEKEMEEFAQDDLDACCYFIPLLEAFIRHLKERFNHVR